MPYAGRVREGVVGCPGRERVAFVPLRDVSSEASDPVRVDLTLDRPMRSTCIPMMYEIRTDEYVLVRRERIWGSEPTQLRLDKKCLKKPRILLHL